MHQFDIEIRVALKFLARGGDIGLLCFKHDQRAMGRTLDVQLGRLCIGRAPKGAASRTAGLMSIYEGSDKRILTVIYGHEQSFLTSTNINE